MKKVVNGSTKHVCAQMNAAEEKTAGPEKKTPNRIQFRVNGVFYSLHLFHLLFMIES